jgi:hypothetical protein
VLINGTFNAIALTALVEIANGRPIIIQELMTHSAGPIQWWSEATPVNTATEERRRGSRARDK